MSARSRRGQAGLSLVELMVSVAIGLFIVAASARLFAGHLDAHRRLLLEARLQQDLRAAAELIARDLRRAGYWQSAVQATSWPARVNPYRAIAPAGSASQSQASYSYSRDAVENDAIDSNEAFGIRLSAGALQLLEGASGWQTLNDTGTVVVTRLVVTPKVRTVSLGHLCSPACSLADASCPRLNLRSYELMIQGRSATDVGVTRELREQVQVRNPELPQVSCP